MSTKHTACSVIVLYYLRWVAYITIQNIKTMLFYVLCCIKWTKGLWMDVCSERKEEQTKNSV